MKNVSIFLFVFFTLSGSLIYNVNSQGSCTDMLFRLQPCIGEIFNLIGLRRPISYSCCSTILNVADSCPPVLQPFWVVKAEKSCIIANLKTPPPAPEPPSDDGTDVGRTPPPAQRKQTPPPALPSHCGKEDCDDLNCLQPCFPNMYDFYGNKTASISSSCCSLILEARDKCSQREWSNFSIRCQNYCMRQH